MYSSYNILEYRSVTTVTMTNYLTWHHEELNEDLGRMIEIDDLDSEIDIMVTSVKWRPHPRSNKPSHGKLPDGLQKKVVQVKA